jgi:ABC-type lipoprotein release transport system permease subunit
MSRRGADLGILLAVACLMLAGGPALAADAVSHLRMLAAGSDRSLGTQGERQAADYVEQVFASLPEELQAKVGRQSFTAPVRSFAGATLRLGGRVIPIAPLFANALATESTGPEGLQGPLVVAGQGRLEDLDGKDLAGSIVLMDLRSQGNWQHAANLGARAVIYLDDGRAVSPRLRFRDKEELTPVDFPRFWLAADVFRASFGRPEDWQGKVAQLHSRSDWVKEVADNVYCFIPGRDPALAGELLIVEAFLDGSRYVAGQAPAADEAVSVATLLDMAGRFGREPPSRSVLLLATSGHAGSLAGLREAVWALVSKGKELKEELKAVRNMAEEAARTVELLSAGALGYDDPDSNAIVHQAIQEEIRNAIEAVNTELRLSRNRPGTDREEIAGLARRKLLLRRLTWEPAYHRLSPQDSEEVARILPKAMARARQVEADLDDRLKALKSARDLRQLVGELRVSAAVSLHLSSHGSGIGALGDGWLYQLNPAVNRSRQYTHIRTVLNRAAGGETAFLDLLGGEGRQNWFNHFPDQPAFGGEVTALGGMPGLTLATANDLRSAWGTPYDTLDRVDEGAVLAQAGLAGRLVGALSREKLPEPPYKAVNGFATLGGRASFLRQGELFPEQEADRVVLQIYQDQQYGLAWVDSLGTFRYPGLADKKHSFGKAIIEGYRFAPGGNRAIWAIDKNTTGKDRYRVKLNRGRSDTDLIMFSCSQTTLFHLRDARSLNPLTRINIIDARTDTEPTHYWYSRIDTRKSTIASLFLEPDTPVKITLSDTILDRKMILLGNSRENPLGRGFLAAATPAVHDTSLQTARDMVLLVTPRVDILESHSIVNQRIRGLLDQARNQLDLAVAARADLLYSAAEEHARNSLSLIARVYNDVGRTQQDVLAGVLFFIALFVPFAYCLERILFGQTSIHRRIASFLGLLAVIIALIYAVHPAFKLTYSPLVVILAFFILGLSLLVALILIGRFEQEMAELQRKARVARVEGIAPLKAFIAAFAIGVSNLRRRKVRTALTCATLVILTYTLLNFTAVKNSLEQGMVRYKPQSPWPGIMLKAVEWKTLPADLDSEVADKLPAGTGLARRVWLEAADRTRPPAIALRAGAGEVAAAGLVGLDPVEGRMTGLERTLVQGRWLDGGGEDQILLPQALAGRLGIGELDAGTRVMLWGIPFTVRGIFDGRAFWEAADLDGEPLTPVIYPNETSSMLSEAEAEAAESGQDISAMASRYQHLPADLTVIIPASTLLAAGGRLKSLAILPGSEDLSHSLAADLADRYRLILLHGTKQGTWLHYSTDALAYSGMGNILIPAVIAILIVLNTMVGSVVERRREIAVYTSVGLAPPHVAMLFIAEALAFGIISGVTGYLAAQTAAHFLAGTPLWAGLTVNYSSLAGVASILIVLAVVLLSVIYPSRVASRIAIPDVNRAWNLPRPVGSTLTVQLPFLIRIHEQDCVGGFLAEYYQAHADVSHGRFSTDAVDVEYACPIEHVGTGHPDCFNISFLAWLAPFDFGIRQRVDIVSCPSVASPGFLEMNITLIRQTGENNVWYRLCRSFLNDLRKQLLIWRSLDAAEKRHYEELLRRRMGPVPDGEVAA